MKHTLTSLALHLVAGGPPFYQQLIDQTKAALTNGRLKPGDKLPSSRHLATALGISRSTVSRAYDQLLSEGIVLSEPKRGLFASDLIPAQAQPTRHALKYSEQTPRLLRCDSGVDTEAFPAREWAKSMRRSWLNPDQRLLAGAYATGYPPLKSAISDYLYRLRGLDCLPEQVFVTGGNRDSLTLLQHALDGLAPDASWWLEDPTYPPIRTLLASRTGGARYLDMDAEGACLPPASPIPQIALLTPNRQYPLGINQSHPRRQAWLRALQEHALWLIEDDYDTEFVYQGRMGLPLLQADTSGKTFLVGSFSKVMFRGLRLGFVVAPLTQCEALSHAQKRLGASASLPIQPALADFMANGQFDRHLNRMRRHYRLKRDQMLSLVAQHLAEVFDWTTPSGGMHLNLRFKPQWLAQQPGEFSDRAIARQLANRGVEIETLSSHYAEAETGQQGFLLGFSNPSPETMAQVIRALARCVLSAGR
ncbi:MAG: MocR-like pyridoxine biosynthesis transcription factor PdxR [Saccharospirillum sp.]